MSPLTYIIGWPFFAAVLLLLIPRNFRPVVRAVAILATFVSALLALASAALVLAWIRRRRALSPLLLLSGVLFYAVFIVYVCR